MSYKFYFQRVLENYKGINIYNFPFTLQTFFVWSCLLLYDLLNNIKFFKSKFYLPSFYKNCCFSKVRFLIPNKVLKYKKS